MTSTSRQSLLHPRLDVILLGGAALLFAFVFIGAGMPAESLLPHVGWLLVFSSYPHFLASYVLLYGRGGPWRRHLGVSVFTPIVLLALMIGAVFYPDARLLMSLAQLAIPLLIWHFVKQAYGASIWLGMVPGRSSLAGWRKQLLLAAALSLGAYGYLGQQQGSGLARAFLIEVPLFEVASWAVRLSAWVAYGCLAAFFLVCLRSSSFGWLGWVPLIALWSWFEPRFSGTAIIVALPVFHALQYLPFPLCVHRQARMGWGWIGAGYFLLALVGAGIFVYLPSWLGAWGSAETASRLPAAFALFLNVHHYFIDAVLWRFRDPEVRSRLWGASVKATRSAES